LRIQRYLVGRCESHADEEVVAGRDLEDVPLYLVPQSILPPQCGSGDHCFAYTTSSLDLYLRDHIPGYRGRGPCKVINDLAVAGDFGGEDLTCRTQTTVLRELAHILDRPALFDDRAGVDPNRILFESPIVANVSASPPREDIPLYHGHEVGFICIALHLCFRAQQLGFDIDHGALCAGHRSGLSHASRYLEALGDEPRRFADMTFRQIVATKPPPTFSHRWTVDFIEYHDRFPLQKGTVMSRWAGNPAARQACRSLGGEPIAHDLFGKDVPWLSWIDFKLPTQAGHEDTQIVVLLRVLGPPDFPQKEPMG
jgi:hypothetical protein